jgi:hypothetical protein
MGVCLARGNIQWPNHLAQDIPSFATWLLNIRVHIAIGVDVDPNVIFFLIFQDLLLICTKACGHTTKIIQLMIMRGAWHV